MASVWLPWGCCASDEPVVYHMSGFGPGFLGPTVLALAALGATAAMASSRSRSLRTGLLMALVAVASMEIAAVATFFDLVRFVVAIENTCGLCSEWPGVGIYLTLASLITGSFAAYARLGDTQPRPA